VQFATGKSADATGSFVERDWGGTAPWAGAFAASKETEGKKMWLALASITLAAAIGFNVLALIIQDWKH
jgi:hypothetical protein